MDGGDEIVVRKALDLFRGMAAGTFDLVKRSYLTLMARSAATALVPIVEAALEDPEANKGVIASVAASDRMVRTHSRLDDDGVLRPFGDVCKLDDADSLGRNILLLTMELQKLNNPDTAGEIDLTMMTPEGTFAVNLVLKIKP